MTDKDNPTREELEADVLWAMQVIEFGDAQQRIQGERVRRLATYALSLFDPRLHGCEPLELHEVPESMDALKREVEQLQERLAPLEEQERKRVAVRDRPWPLEAKVIIGIMCSWVAGLLLRGCAGLFGPAWEQRAEAAFFVWFVFGVVVGTGLFIRFVIGAFILHWPEYDD